MRTILMRLSSQKPLLPGGSPHPQPTLEFSGVPCLHGAGAAPLESPQQAKPTGVSLFRGTEGGGHPQELNVPTANKSALLF